MSKLQQIKDEAERLWPTKTSIGFSERADEVERDMFWRKQEQDKFIKGGTYALALDNWVRCEDEEPPICPEFLAFMSDGTMSIEKHEWSTSLNRYFYNPHITHWKIKPLPPQTTLSTK